MKTQRIIHKNIDNKANSYESTLSTWAGLFVLMSLVVFFIVMKVVGLYEVLELRYFNFILLLSGILTAFYNYRQKLSVHGIDYLTGLRMGLHISLIAVLPFAIFMGVYLKIDEGFMNYVKEYAEFGRYLSPGIVSGVIAIEGIASGAITTFIAMQYFKRND